MYCRWWKKKEIQLLAVKYSSVALLWRYRFRLNVLPSSALQLFTWPKTMCVFLVTLCLNIRWAQDKQLIQLKLTHHWWGGYLQSGGHSNTVKCSTVMYYITSLQTWTIGNWANEKIDRTRSLRCSRELTCVIWHNSMRQNFGANKINVSDILPPLSVWLQSYKRKQQLIITCVPVRAFIELL